MDFRFRAIDDNKSPPTPTSSSSRSSDHLLQDDSLNAELLKQRIKEEIMIREIASRRMLEAEIRTELHVGQELGIRRATGRTEGFSLDEQFAIRLLNQRLNHNVNPSTRGLLAVPGSSFSLNSLPVRPFSDPQKEEMKPLDDEKNKLVILPRPNPEKLGGKRKAEEVEAAKGDHADQTVSTAWISSKKLAKEEFVCKMCKIKATGEMSFNAHLKGKKHMAKQRRGPTVQTQDEEQSPGEDHKKPTSENKRLKFWCKICEIGTPCMAIMASHNNGKKHKARLLRLDQKEEPLMKV